MSILIIEDDETIAEVVQEGLETARYHVEVANDGEQGLALAREGAFSLILLDLMLPGIDGIEICRRLRAARSTVPILMLTARDALDDRVLGLDTGADDYLTKPFEFPELLARVRALLRRELAHRSRTITVADLEMDTVDRRVTRAGREIHLTPREYDLLAAMISREGTVVSREFIMERVWMGDSYSNTVDVCIGQLRKKVDANSDVKLIHTVHRLGYMLRRPNEESAP